MVFSTGVIPVEAARVQSAPPAVPTQDSLVRPAQRERALLGVGQTLAVNVVINRVDAWILGADWAKAGSRSWSRNLRQGWEWDEDAFRPLPHPASLLEQGRHQGIERQAVALEWGRAYGLVPE